MLASIIKEYQDEIVVPHIGDDAEMYPETDEIDPVDWYDKLCEKRWEREFKRRVAARSAKIRAKIRKFEG